MLPERGAGTESGNAGEGEVCSGVGELLSAPNFGTLLLDHGPLCAETPSSSTETSVQSSEGADAWGAEVAVPAGPFPRSGCGLPGTCRARRLQNEHKTSLEVANLGQSPNRSGRGRTGRASGTGEPERSQSQPTTAAGFPGSKHTGRHRKSPARLKPGLRQVSPPSWEGSRAAAPASPGEHPPRIPAWHRHGHPPRGHGPAPPPSHHQARGFCPDVSPSLPFLSGGFPSAAPRGTVTSTVWQATPPTRSQPHPSGACFVIPFSDSSFFTCHPVLLLLSSQLPPAWLWSSPFLKDVVCILSSYLAPLHSSLPAFPKAIRAGFGQMQGWCEEPAPELTECSPSCPGSTPSCGALCDSAQNSLITQIFKYPWSRGGLHQPLVSVSAPRQK